MEEEEQVEMKTRQQENAQEEKRNEKISEMEREIINLRLALQEAASAKEELETENQFIKNINEDLLKTIEYLKEKRDVEKQWKIDGSASPEFEHTEEEEIIQENGIIASEERRNL